MHRTLCLVALLCAASTLTACGARIRTLYEQSREEALADPGAAGPGWTPDARLGISWDLVTALAAHELRRQLEDPDAELELSLPLGASASVKPDLELQDTSVAAAKACDTCLRVKSSFAGDLEWSLGGLRGQVPVKVQVSAVLELLTREQGDTTHVEASLRQATVRLPDAPEVERLRIALDDPLAEWIKERVEADFPPIPLAELGTGDMPVRAVRLESSDGHVLVHALSTSPVQSPGLQLGGGSGDWFVCVDQAALLGLARRASFEAGELEYQVYADPRSLSVQDQEFTMGLRLWRLAGVSWWRDYQVSGTLGLSGQRVELEATEVLEVDHSRGAGLVDPLALLGRGVILSAIEDALHIARPAQLEGRLAGATLLMNIDAAAGQDGALLASGSWSLEERGSGEQRSGSGRSRKGKGRKQKKTAGSQAAAGADIPRSR